MANVGLRGINKRSSKQDWWSDCTFIYGIAEANGRHTKLCCGVLTFLARLRKSKNLSNWGKHNWDHESWKSLICLAYHRDWEVTRLVYKYLHREKIKGIKRLINLSERRNKNQQLETEARLTEIKTQPQFFKIQLFPIFWYIQIKKWMLSGYLLYADISYFVGRLKSYRSVM